MYVVLCGELAQQFEYIVGRHDTVEAAIAQVAQFQANGFPCTGYQFVPPEPLTLEQAQEMLMKNINEMWGE